MHQVAQICMPVEVLLDVFAVYCRLNLRSCRAFKEKPAAPAAAISLRPDATGAASGLLGALQIGLGALMSIICGVLVADGQAPVPFAVAVALCAVISMVFALACPRGTQHR